MSDALMVPLSELARRTGKSKRTIRRWLRRKGIRSEGQGVYLAVLKDRWPTFYVGLQGPAPVPMCAACGVPARCECRVCGEEVRAG